MTTLVNRLRRRQKGFTLIELLVVVAIIALLAAFAVPKLFDAIDKSKKAPGQADMQTISGALERYYMDNNVFPPVASVVADLENGYLKTSTTYRNGFKYQYVYFKASDGEAYALVDIGRAAITYTSGAATATVCGKTITLSETARALATGTATKAELTACTAPSNDGAALVRN